MPDQEKRTTRTRMGLEITVLVVLIGAVTIAVLKAIYPQTDVDQYLALVVVCSFVAAGVLDLLLHRWKNRRDPS